MVKFRQNLILGASGLAILSNIYLYSQSQIQKGNLEAKAVNYSIEDTAKNKGNSLIERNEFVETARGYLDETYSWGGRLTKKNPGIDCLGLIFLSYSKTFEVPWKNFSVNPSEIIEKKQLGKPVKGLDGILVKNVDISKLEEGDIIYLLTTSPIEDKYIAEINGIKYWPWHTGIYSDKEKNLFLEANPGSKVIERNFSEVIHQKPTKAIFVTRIY